MNTLYPVICSTALVSSKEFYINMFDFNVLFELDWYIHLGSPVNDALQIAFVKQNHPSVPEIYQKSAQGILISFEFDDVDKLYKKAKQLKSKISYDLKNEEWGQRHFMIVDPNGLLVDIIQMINPSQEFLVANGLA